MHISYSDTTAWQRCPRYYLHRCVFRRVPVRESTALRVGTAWHTAMESYWTDGGGKPAAAKALQECAADIDEVDCARLAAMLEHYAPPVERYEVRGIEQRLDMPIIDPDSGKRLRGVSFRGIADLVLWDKDRRELVIVDHKTTSSQVIGFGPFWQGLTINRQLTWYRQAVGAHCVIYDAAKKPNYKPSAEDRKVAGGGDVLEAFRTRVSSIIAAEPEAWYQWREIRLTDDEICNAMRDLCAVVYQIRQAHQHNRWPCAPGQCVTRYGDCEYLDVCSGRARLDDDASFRDVGEGRYTEA